MSFPKSQESDSGRREIYSRAKHLTCRELPIREMDEVDLQRERLDLQKEVDLLRTQLGEAKSLVWEKGEYADCKWFRAAENALRYKGRQMQEIQLKLTEFRKSKFPHAKKIHEPSQNPH